MNNLDKQYLDILKDIAQNGYYKNTRAGITNSLFGKTIRLNLQDGFPLLTTKKMYYKGIIHELLWFLNGDTNIKYLIDNNVHIWDDDAYRYYLEKIKENNSFAANNPEFKNLEKKVLSEEEYIEKVKKGEKLELGNNFLGKFKYTCGDLGPVYGKQWRNWGGHDQIKEIVEKLRNNPDDRRIILNAWNVGDLNKMALPPCHMMAQFYSRVLSPYERAKIYEKTTGKTFKELNELKENNIPERDLSCFFYCRSQDFPLGTPYNIASYALLTHLIAKCVGMAVGELIYFGGDCHIYLNQMDGVNVQLNRNPIEYDLPELIITGNNKEIDRFKYEDIHIENYHSYPTISFPLSVGL